MTDIMTVVQCWDDGVGNDVRLAEVCRSHGATATFNLNAGLHADDRSHGWEYKNTDVQRLGWSEMKTVYDGFTIANHGLAHPRLEQIPIEEARRDIIDGRDRLQQFFDQPVRGFAYPFGTYSDEVKAALREAGHVYARTIRNVARPFPPEDAMAFHPCCHFLAPDLAERYEEARAGGVFYFWGHSYEILSEAMWDEFDGMIARISADPGSRWGELAELFEGDGGQ